MNDITHPKEIDELMTLADQIYFKKTKLYFEEVISSYRYENYRSAVMTLWSIVLFDIIEKLHNLVDIYNDAAARSILEELEKVEEDIPNRKWAEKDLLDRLKKETKIINQIDHTNLSCLLEQRHLAAHPINSTLSSTTEDRSLYNPSKDTTKALMIGAMSSLLTKPPYYSQGIRNNMLDHLKSIPAFLLDKDTVKTVLEEHFLENMTSEVQLKLYRSLWRLVFILDDSDCSKNRRVNFYALEAIGNKNEGNLIDIITGELDYYSNIKFNKERMRYLIMHLSNFPGLYNVLRKGLKDTISRYVKSDYNINLIAGFMKGSLEEHLSSVLYMIDDIKGEIEVIVWETLNELISTEKEIELFCKIIAKYYTNSKSQNNANYRFSETVGKYIDMFNIGALAYLLQRIESNNHTYLRRESADEHTLIYERVNELDQNFNFSEYKNFHSNLSSGISTTEFIAKPKKGDVSIKRDDVFKE